MTLLPCTAVLFDNDGVLVDSDASVTRTWSAWAVARDLDPGMVLDLVHGRPSRDTVAVLIHEADRAAALADIDARELDDAAHVVALPGAAALLHDVPRWAVVTSGTRVLASARLRAAGLPTPPALITADDVTDGKPHPEGYLAAAASLGVDPRQAIVVEDSPAGIDAARAARVGWVLGVGERALETDADVVVRDLSEVEWDGSGLRIRAALRSLPA